MKKFLVLIVFLAMTIMSSANGQVSLVLDSIPDYLTNEEATHLAIAGLHNVDDKTKDVLESVIKQSRWQKTEIEALKNDRDSLFNVIGNILIYLSNRELRSDSLEFLADYRFAKVNGELDKIKKDQKNYAKVSDLAKIKKDLANIKHDIRKSDSGYVNTVINLNKLLQDQRVKRNYKEDQITAYSGKGDFNIPLDDKLTTKPLIIDTKKTLVVEGFKPFTEIFPPITKK